MKLSRFALFELSHIVNFGSMKVHGKSENVREKSGHLELEDKLQPCLVFLCSVGFVRSEESPGKT